MSHPLTGHIYTSVSTDQVTHRLTEDGWSSFDLGPLRVTVPIGDLTKVRSAKALAIAIEAHAGFWRRDLEEIEARLMAAEEAATRTPPPTASLPATPQPPQAEATAVLPPVDQPRPEPVADEPFGGDDPALDTKILNFVTIEDDDE